VGVLTAPQGGPGQGTRNPGKSEGETEGKSEGKVRDNLNLAGSVYKWLEFVRGVKGRKDLRERRKGGARRLERRGFLLKGRGTKGSA